MAEHATGPAAALDWLLSNWWMIFLAWFLFGWMIEGVRDFAVETFEMLTGIRHRRRLAELKAREKAAKTAARVPALPESARPKPGPCVHRNVVPVVSAADDVIAWLCKTCDTQLPASWAVREEDL